MQELAVQTKQIGYPVLPLVKQLVSLVNGVEPGLGEWAHWGTTTQDVTDTATVLQLRDTLEIVERTLDDIVAALRDISLAHAATPMAARSNLQQAIPMTFGFKTARLLATFQRHKERLGQLLPRLLVLEFGGAVGTLATLADTGVALEVQRQLAEELKLGVPDIAWHTERDRIAEAGAFLAMVTGTCAKSALDIKLLMQTEVAEVSEPFYPHRGSSSTMPQKRNPISCVYITAMASTIRQLSTALLDAMVQDHERSTGPWEIEWIVLPQICTLSHATLQQTRDLVRGLEVHPDTMRRNLQLTRGAIVSEAAMMKLGITLGRQAAHDLIYDECRKLAAADAGEKTLAALLADNPEVKKAGIGRVELEDMCDPEKYLGLCVDMIRKILDK
ncbi:L-Aspartase-like protein [Coprinellus micaceus]|uniref:L-Aspartase-like protein n=1 Tax=Coprinellus micaceus TaxID=71717 RepID=A0A4Y7T7P3_COPMI|nr:L-Aspartase-like protein [Coprinellus micaceus]